MRYEDEIRLLDSLGRGRSRYIHSTGYGVSSKFKVIHYDASLKRVHSASPRGSDREGHSGSNSADSHKSQKNQAKSHSNSRKRLVSPILARDVGDYVVKRSVGDMLRTATGKSQAIFKITNYGKGRRKIANHLSYISRNGTLELETESGEKLVDRAGPRALLEAWQMDFGTNKRSRDTLHLVLSTPPGTPRISAESAAREFLVEAFGKQGYEYLFVAHQDTQHPHVHAVIKMQSIYGYKLNPRKADLHQFRAHFAKICRSYGIEVEASTRAERGLNGQSQKSALVQMKRTKRQPRVDQALIEKVKWERQTQRQRHPSEVKTLKRNQIIRKRYAEAGKALLQKANTFPDPKVKQSYEQAANVLDTYAKKLPFETNRGDKLHQQIEQKLKNLSPEAQAQLETLKRLNQYLAVTQGQLNEQGIYQSALENFPSEPNISSVRVVSSLDLSKKNLAWDLDLDLDLDLDMNDG